MPRSLKNLLRLRPLGALAEVADRRFFASFQSVLTGGTGVAIVRLAMKTTRRPDEINRIVIICG